MSIYLTKDKKIIVQGITGTVGKVQTELALEYGTNIVGGVVPGKGGSSILGIPVYNTVKEAVDEKGANASIIYVPAKVVKSAADESIMAGLELIVIITEHVPIADTLNIRALAREKGVVVIGPNCPGILAPNIGKMGIIPGHAPSPGHIGIISRSGTLAFEVAANLTAAEIGQSTIVGIGGDPVPCTSMIEALAAFEEDCDTKGVVIIGEVGGTAEESASLYIKQHMSKPVFAYIAGLTAPPGKKMGHAGAIIKGSSGTPKSKIEALSNAGVKVASSPKELPKLILKSGIV